MEGWLEPPPRSTWMPLVDRALAEDLGTAGDLTTESIVPADRKARALVVARSAGVVAGVSVAGAVFERVEPRIRVTSRQEEGASVPSKTVLAELEGPARGLLIGERVALNFLGRLCGIATTTRQFVDAIAGTGTRIVCTRKTTPGLRALEKYAVRAGGGVNHRFGLNDAVLIKDNHIALAGSVEVALRRARDRVGHLVEIEIEVDTLEQLEEALGHGAEAVLLDNMSLAELRHAVGLCRGRAATEASGGITLDTARGVAETGVERLSVGWLTHSAPALDVGLDWS